MDVDPASPTPRGTAAEVFLAFLRLGVTSFGGPIAHFGYFHNEFVVRRRWLDETSYADLVALSQFLPGPASSQTGFAIGLMRAGPLGAAAAWIAFTLPSALLLLAFAYGAPLFSGPVGSGIIHGLKVTAVAVVAQAIWGMARTLAPDRSRASIALAAALMVLVYPGGAAGQLLAIAAGAIAGLALCRGPLAESTGRIGVAVTHRTGMVLLAVAVGLLVILPVAARLSGSQAIALFEAFYRAGALVFGGGHVVLPLLRSTVVDSGWVSPDAFLAGYGAAQAVPGPLFTFAAYLGAVMGPVPNGVPGAAIALIAIFLPGLLLVTGALPFWDALRERPHAQAAMRGANAAVVGILGAALYDPVWTSAVLSRNDFALALTGFILLTVWRLPSWIVVAVCALGGIAIALT